MQQTIEEIIHKISPFLKENFDIKCPDTTIEIVSKEELTELSKTIDSFKEKESYFPIKNTILLAEESTPIELIHEYYGHALFTHNTKLGKKTLNYIEKIKEFGLEKISLEGIRAKFPETSEERALVEEYLDFFEKARPHQETFALFMEYFILGLLGEEKLWEKREEELRQSPYYNNLIELSHEMKNKGPLTVFYKVGFPISKKQKIIKKFAEENIDLNKVLLLIQYGSLEKDIDLLAVYPDEYKINQKLIYDRPLDLNQFNLSTFLENCSLLDVEITEAVLNGKLIKGDKKAFNKIKEEIKAIKPSEACQDFLKRKALESYNYAKTNFNEHRYKTSQFAICNSSINIEEIIEKMESNPESSSNQLFQSLQNLSFSLSYNFLSSYYKDNQVTSFNQIIKQYPLLKELRTYLKKEKIEESKAEYFLEKGFEDIKK